ncbi:hypothetical protein ABIB81_009275 [Bradyrhizobium sp. I1.7.5]
MGQALGLTFLAEEADLQLFAIYSVELTTAIGKSGV